jgi:nitroreductase
VESSNPTLATLVAHRSVRHFSPEPLPGGTLERLVRAGQQAATSSNLQSWSVVALEDPARKLEAAKLCGDQKFIKDAPLFLVFCADLARLKSVSDSVEQPGDALDYLEMFLTAVIDASLAAQNVAVAAESEGLGICYVGAARNHPRELSALLKLPPRVFAVFGMAVGLPDPSDTSSVKPRLPQRAVLHRETYDPDVWQDSVPEYNAIMASFYATQNRDVRGTWDQHSARRVGSAAALMGRDTLREVLADLGFPLQ